MERNDEIKFYLDHLPSIFRSLNIKGFVTVARWPFIEKDRVLVTIPVGELTNEEQRRVNRARKHLNPEVLENFSFTTLIRENGRPVWFRFWKGDKNEITRINDGPRSSLHISYRTEEKLSDDSFVRFVRQLVGKLQEVGLTRYGKGKVSDHSLLRAVKDTFNSAVVDVLRGGITHIYFIPVSSPLGREEILGIFALNSINEVNEQILVNVVPHVATAMMFPFHMQELHQLVVSYALRSAVAAIMARNWAHIFTSQVLVRFKGAGRESTIPNELLDYIITRSEYIADVTGEIPLLWGEGFLECQETEGGEKSGILEEFRRTSILKKLEEAAGSKISSILIQSEGLCERIGFPFGAAVGRHAIFAILENYIRNVSKYGVLPTTETNTLVIELSKRKDDGAFITVKLSSNSKIGTETEWEERASGIGRHISEPVIDQTGALPPSGWGLREMKIHACLVAGEDISALLAEGQPHFFQFDEQAEKERGEYTFYFKVRRYQPVLKFDSEDKLNEFLQNPMKPPLCDFVVLQKNQANSYNERTWATFPSRVAIAGTAKDKSWLTNRVIFLNTVPTDENALISRLWEEFWNLLLARGARAYEIVIVDNGQPIRLGQSQQGDTIAIYHGDDQSLGAAKRISKDHILFSHQKLMMIWINEVHQKKKEVHQRKRIQDTHPEYVVNDRDIIFKWKTLLGAKVLLIDTRLYEQYNRLGSEAQKQLKNLLGVYVIPETEEIGQNLKIKSCNMCLNKFQFVSVHYGYLQENPNTPLLKENKLASFPPFVFMHTARGKIEAEFVEKYYWFRKIVSVGSLISAFNEELPLEIKMRLMAVFLSPQQGGKAL